MANHNANSDMGLENSVLGGHLSTNSSDDEGEVIPKVVENYSFTDEKDEPISFTVLPIDFDGDEIKAGSKRQVFLQGTADSGLQKVYKPAIAWKLQLEEEGPSVYVKTKEKVWIKLQKPRKSFEETIRSFLVAAHFLHFSKRNPEAPEKAYWDHLRKVFSMYDVKPTDSDLEEHFSVIDCMYQRDQKLGKSDVLKNFMEAKSKKRKPSDEDAEANLKPKKPKVYMSDEEPDDELEDDGMDESDEEEDDLFDSVCAICDNGGELLCCEGPCLRSFHPNKEAGADSNCRSLRLTKAQVKEIQNFYCLNCKYKQHQCFICGKLGSSDKTSGAEVFSCVAATCGRFYHPQCVSKMLVSEDEADDLADKITSGLQFTCPVHKCVVCKQGEHKDDEQLQFAICRRCPKSYHRKCLPKFISFEETDDEPQRAWDDLIPNRILIYCRKHKIDPDLATPKRNHIIFPEEPSTNKTIVKKKPAVSPEPSTLKVASKKNSVISPESSREKIVSKPLPKKEKSTLSAREIASVKARGAADFPKKVLKERDTSPSVKKEDKHPSLELKKSLGQKELSKSKLAVLSSSKSELKKKSTALPAFLESDIKNWVMGIVERSTAGLSLDEVCAKHQVPSTHRSYSRNLDKTITQGKVEGSVEAARTALKKLEEGGSIDDAKAVCEPDMLNHIQKWKNKLKVYLAPFLHGMRYTSFGRHFTKVDKLQEVIERLHCYVQSGDTIVDFCCGANDFSRLMKEKLEQTGKKCFFKNFDIIQPKNDFEFEKRDWLTVRKDELPTGTRLIMGLNPPFGVKAALANKFIDKALQFKPKLLILIVPIETKRLDEKPEAYDLIWEDLDLLKGQSFYFPGSVGIDDQQLGQWNTVAPPLYLWSRPDWTIKHKAIAIKQGHIGKGTSDTHMIESQTEVRDAYPLIDEQREGNGFQTVEGKPNAERNPEKENQRDSGFRPDTIDRSFVDSKENDSVKPKLASKESQHQKDESQQKDASAKNVREEQEAHVRSERHIPDKGNRDDNSYNYRNFESRKIDKETDVPDQSHGRSTNHGRRQDRGSHNDEYGREKWQNETSPTKERTDRAEKDKYEMGRYDRDTYETDRFEKDRFERDRHDNDRSKRDWLARERPEKDRIEKERPAYSPTSMRMESRNDPDTDQYGSFLKDRGSLPLNAMENITRAFEREPGNREDLARGFHIGSSSLGQEFGRGYQGISAGTGDEDYGIGYRRGSGNVEDGFGRVQRSVPGKIEEEYGRGIQLGLPGHIEEEYATREIGRGFRRNFAGSLEPEYSVSTTELHMMQNRAYDRQGQHDFESERARLFQEPKIPEWVMGDPSQRGRYLSEQGSHMNNAYSRSSDLMADIHRPYMLGHQYEEPSRLPARMQYHSEAHESGLNSSAMQRYAPRLDQHMNFGRSSLHHVEQASRPAALGSQNFPFDPRGFAPGPQNPFPHQSSSGWLDE